MKMVCACSNRMLWCHPNRLISAVRRGFVFELAKNFLLLVCKPMQGSMTFGI